MPDTLPDIAFNPIADALANKPVAFDVIVPVLQPDGSLVREIRCFYLAWPTTAQYDDAQMLYEVAERAYLASGLLADLRDVPAPEIQGINASAGTVDQATLLARVYAALRRDRWLVSQLLCDEHGKRLFDTATPEGLAAWERLPLAVKEGARPVLWRMLEIVRDLPFVSATPSASGSESPSAPASPRFPTRF
jgi:hypothetical protein